MVSRFILGPFDLGDRATFLAANESHMADIIRRNPQLRFKDFLWPHPLRPKVFIMNGIMTVPQDYAELWHDVLENAAPFQVSPDFAGTAFWPKYNRESRNPETIHYEG